MCSSTLYPCETLLKKFVANRVCTDDCTLVTAILLVRPLFAATSLGDANGMFLEVGDVPTCAAVFGELLGVCTLLLALRDNNRFFNGGETSSPVVSGADGPLV